MRREPFWTLPNTVSLSRFVMAAGFLAARSTEARLALIGAASLSDLIDGWIARSRGQVTRLGALLDPIADRTFVLVAVMVYVARGEITRGQYFVLIARDLATAIGFLVARLVPELRTVSFRARLAGKVVTTLQLVTLVAVLVVPVAVPWLVGAVGVMSAISIWDYTLVLWRARTAA
jgi:cardiolipin synthase (CMP-forming)